MSDTNDILDAIDRARDAAVGRAFDVLVANIIDGAPDAQGKFLAAIRRINQAHAMASDAARAARPAQSIGEAVIAELDREGL